MTKFNKATISEELTKTDKTFEDEDVKEKKLSVFDHWKNITQLKVEYDENDTRITSSYSPYMMNKAASMVNAFLQISAEINKYQDIDKETHYRFYSAVLPKRYIKFDWIKPKKDVRVEDKKLVGTYFEIGKRDIELAMKILDEKTLYKIRKMYGGLQRD